MKKAFPLLFLTAAAFLFGFAFNQVVTNQKNTKTGMKKVTGIGGIFFKCKDPQAMKEWYAKHLGLQTNDYGAEFHWYEEPDSSQKASTQWTPFAETTKYFDPSTKNYMINYRVQNLAVLVDELKKEGVTILDNIETYDFGKFVHILDAEGNKVELWEPVD